MGMEHYIKVRDLGGTNGAFLARDRHQPSRLVVIKRLADGTQGMEELNASLRLRHPHVIRFLESFLFDGALYVVMHYEQGGDLDELFQYLKERRKTPTTHTLLLWFVQLLEALTFCHANHVIHRDIKPSNILVSEDTKLLYLGDFGSAKTLDTSNMTSTLVGSPLWISPEVLMGTKYSYAADIWSLGCVFYEMTTLRKPFSAPSFAHLVQQITRGQIAPLPPNVAVEVRSIIQSMLRLQPAERVTAAAALEVARAALVEADARRNVTPTPVRSPAPPTNVPASSSPVRSTPVAPLVLSGPKVIPSHSLQPPGQHQQPQAAPVNSSLPRSRAEDHGTASAPPGIVTGSPTHDGSSGAATPLTNALSTATLASSSCKGSVRQGTETTTSSRSNHSLKTGKKVSDRSKRLSSPTAAPIRKKRAGGDTSSPSASTRSNTLPMPAVEPVVIAAAENGATAECTDVAMKSLSNSTAKSCEPQQMVLNIPTAAFRKPLTRKKPVAARTAAVKRPAAAAAQLQRQQVSSVPAPPADSGSSNVPNFVRQQTAETLVGRRLSSASAAEVAKEQLDSLHAQDPKVVVKALPPRALAVRAKAAAESPSNQRRAPGESPTRAAAAPPPLVDAGAKLAPVPRPMVPTGTQTPKTRGGAAAVHVPADEWLDQRMRELSAMENYLYQHRVDDNKVLQTYDARRNEEQHQQEAAAAGVAVRPPQSPSPALQRLSPSKAFASPTRSPDVLVVSPPAPHRHAQQQQQRGHVGTVSTNRHGGNVASPFHQQASYTRQPSHTGAAYDSRQGSVASTFNGRQASNARSFQPISEEEHHRLEEERAAAREKREAERRRMKELIQEQRAAAKKQQRKTKKAGSGKGAVEVDIVLPDRKHFAATAAE